MKARKEAGLNRNLMRVSNLRADSILKNSYEVCRTRHTASFFIVIINNNADSHKKKTGAMGSAFHIPRC